MIEIRQKKLSIAEVFLAAYYAWFFLPYLRVTFNSSLFKNVFFACFVIGIGLLSVDYLLKTGGRVKVRFNMLVSIVCYMVVMTCFAFFNYYDASDHVRVSFTFWGTALVFYLMSYNHAAQRRFGKFLIFLLLINCLTSIIGVFTNERAARALTNASTTADALEEDSTLAKQNISSIYLFQALAVIAPIFVYMLKKRKKIIWAAIGLTFIIVAVLKASFTICLLLLIVGIVLSLFYAKGSKVRLLLALSIIVILFLPWSTIFGFLANIIDNTYISSRLLEVSLFFSTGHITGDVASRSTAYLLSIQTFLQHPFGIGAHYSYIAGENGIGYHSQVFDDLARYGVFALAFYIAFLSQYYKLLKRRWCQIEIGEVVFPVFIVYFGFLILNIAFRSSAESVVILFILPVLPDIVLDQRNNNGGVES